MRATILHTLLLALFALALALPASAGEKGGRPAAGGGDKGGQGQGGQGGDQPGPRRPPPGGPLQEILDHAKELNLTEDQVAQLEALKKDFRPPPPPGDKAGKREKRGDKPNGDGQKPAGDMGGDKPEKPRDPPPPPPNEKQAELFAKIREILTPEQMEKLREIHEKQPKPPGGKGGQGGGGDKGGNKPDNSKGAPKVFE
jgi:Spy/CpxP family protein refolding chaperone